MTRIIIVIGKYKGLEKPKGIVITNIMNLSIKEIFFVYFNKILIQINKLFRFINPYTFTSQNFKNISTIIIFIKFI